MDAKERFLQWTKTYFSPNIVDKYQEDAGLQVTIVEADDPANTTGEVKYLVYSPGGRAKQFLNV